MLPNNYIADFVKSYLVTAEWAEFDSTDKRKGFSKSAIQIAKADCQTFIDKVFAEFTISEAESILNYMGNDVSYLAGHELYLTRNRHGAGFWDRDIWDELAQNGCKRLTDIAHSMGEASLYKGAGGYLYF